MKPANTPISLPPCANEKVAAPLRPFRHLTEVQTRFNDYDMLGHLNNSVYLQFMDLAKVRYFEAVTGSPLDMSGITVVIVNINVSFYSPSLPQEPLAVATACVKISRHSFVLEQRVVNSATGDVKCVAATVMAAFDPRTMSSAELDSSWASALSRFEEFGE